MMLWQSGLKPLFETPTGHLQQADAFKHAGKFGWEGDISKKVKG
jgi:hypothetical protein